MKLEQIFENNFDCYADTWSEQNGKMIEGDVVMVMTKEKFVEVVKNIAVLDDVSCTNNELYCGHEYVQCEKWCGNTDCG